MLGLGFLIHGIPKLIPGPGHEGFVGMLAGLGVPMADAMGWVVGVVEVLGAVMLLLGAWTRIAALMLIVVMSFAMVLVHLPNGFGFINITGMSETGPLFGMPGIEVNLMYIAGLLALLIGGAGVFSIDNAREGHSVVVRRDAKARPADRPSVVH
jgi:putative oxidoreductase